jgi:hypothetical protein
MQISVLFTLFDSANLRPNMIGHWYLNTMSSGAPACSSVYPLCQLGELFFPADPDEELFGFCHFEPGGRFLVSIRISVWMNPPSHALTGV